MAHFPIIAIQYYYFSIALTKDRFVVPKFGEENKRIIEYLWEKKYMFRFGETAPSPLSSSENMS